MKKVNILRTLVLAMLVAGGCDERSPVVSRQATKLADQPLLTAATHTPAAPPQKWPDEWLVVSEDEWLPAFNRVGSELSAAHKHFLGANHDTARRHTLGAVSGLRVLASGEPSMETLAELDPATLEHAASELEVLAERLKSREVTRSELEHAFIEAHRAALAWDWLHRTNEALPSALELPFTQLRRARSRLKANAHAATAVQLRHGVAYLRLDLLGARADDQSLLGAELDQLNELARAAARGELTEDALRAGLIQADSAYAAAFLRQAQQMLDARQRVAAGRALREAAAHLRACGDWTSWQRAEGAPSPVVRELDDLGSALGRGARVPARRVADVVARAASVLEQLPEPTRAASEG